MSAAIWFTIGFFSCFAALSMVGVVVIRMILKFEPGGQHAEVTRDEP